MEIGVNEMEFAVYAYSILATLLVGFLSVISASIVDKKTLIALCIISGLGSNFYSARLRIIFSNADSAIGWLVERHHFENPIEWYRYVLMYSRFTNMHQFMNSTFSTIQTGKGIHPICLRTITWASL